jgi:hypothetical protein
VHAGIRVAESGSAQRDQNITFLSEEEAVAIAPVFLNLYKQLCWSNEVALVFVMIILLCICSVSLIPVSARSKALVFCSLVAGIAGSNPARGHGSLSLFYMLCCPV